MTGKKNNTARIEGFTITYRNSEEYHRLKQEIFTQDNYYFETDNPTPVIIDAGAHIGLATLYFKKLFPSAEVIAIEPHPENLTLLEQNVFENQLENVTVVPAALDSAKGNKTFYSDITGGQWFSTASFSAGAWTGQQQSSSFSVPTVPLTDFLDRQIDFLKMDIEGAEQAVLSAAGEKVRRVKHMMIEFHPMAHQSLTTTIELLEKLGFSVSLWKDGKEADLKKLKGLVLLEAQLTK